MKLVRYSQTDPQFPAYFTGILDKQFNDFHSAEAKQFNPAADIAEDDMFYEIHIAVPGVKKQDFKIDLIDGKLTISGERKIEEKKDEKIIHSLETQYGFFSRSFFIPEDVKADKV